MRLPGCNLYRYAIAQQLVGAQIGLIQGDAGGVGGGQELLQRSRNVRIGITTLLEVAAQKICFDAAVVVTFAPLTQVIVPKAVRATCIGKQSGNTVLRLALGAGLFRHDDLGLRSAFPVVAQAANHFFLMGKSQLIAPLIFLINQIHLEGIQAALVFVLKALALLVERQVSVF
jgi:hypothetical protein